MSDTMRSILADTRRVVGAKLAAAKAAEITGTPPNSMPGSEHDKAAPAEALKPQPETRDGTMVPNSGLTTAGAGDDSAITHTGDLTADEAAKNPTKKPLVTADADAKQASASADLANEILGLVRTHQKAAAAPAAVAAPAAAVPEKVAAAPAPAVAAPAAVAVPAKTAAPTLDMELTTDVMAKIASLVLATEDGATMVQGLLQKSAGAEAARETIAFLAEQADLAEKAAAWEQGRADAEAALSAQIFEAGVKQGQAQIQQHPLFKLGQAAADASMPAGGASEPDGDEGQGTLTEEDILQALQMLVQDGTLDQETAEAVLQELLVGDEGGAEAAPDAATAGTAGVEGAAGAAGAGDMGAAGGAGDPGSSPEKSAAATLLDTIKALKVGK